ncbi:hypothetical protein AO376_0814 [Moraxella catarrhalis]|nr:hypothetical protein AO376_0814 [Moraxella catarrhalis]OAV17401.1 hypothetical protein AO374_1188 [Moraxella catarrhalis]
MVISSIQKHQDTALAAFSSNQMGGFVEIKVGYWCFCQLLLVLSRNQ